MKYFDVIVIGSGISGLNFALRAAEKHSRVLIVTKKRIALAGTNFAQGGIAAVLSKLDDYKKHIEDTLVAGCYHNNKKAVQYMVKYGPKAIARLIELGVPFTTREGKLLLTREGGHSKRRIAFVSDYTGQAIENVLVKNIRKNKNITLYEHSFASDLLVKNNTCYGVQILRKNKLENIYADKIVLATGGIGQIYRNTTNPSISTGDGIALAARYGCKVQDLEFVQFHPTALKLKGKPCFLISEAVRGEGAYLISSKGERFINELSPRDIVARAIFKEEKLGTVFLDLRHKDPVYIKTRFPQIYKTLKSYGLDMTKKKIPVSPAAHYICGGIKINLYGETHITHLYAFGETAYTGVHGANRLASNSLLEALVFSDRILRKKTKYKKRNTKKNPDFKIPKLKPSLKIAEKEILKIQKTLKETMWTNVGIIRNKLSLSKALLIINSLQKKLEKLHYNDQLYTETKNMLDVASLITLAAQKRKRSLGCHFRYKLLKSLR